MTNIEKIAYIRRAMQSYKSDDLERATAAFRACSPEQMQQQYGQSGETRQQIIDGYNAERNQWNECTAWLSRLFREAR